MVTLATGKPIQWQIQAEKPRRLRMASSVLRQEKTSLEASERTLEAVCMQLASLWTRVERVVVAEVWVQKVR